MNKCSQLLKNFNEENKNIKQGLYALQTTQQVLIQRIINEPIQRNEYKELLQINK